MAQRTGDHVDNLESRTTPVIDFYAGKSIFITGGTGFVGLVLVEKLLYTCDHIKNLYLLIRPKKGKTARDRLAELLTSSAFERLKTKKPTVLEKIVPVHGDVREDCLGISPEEQEVICKSNCSGELLDMKDIHRYPREIDASSQMILEEHHVTYHEIEVAIVFHVAASINLDASLKDTLEINAKGTLNALSLCQKMTHLQALVHVSSAYSNCNRDFVGEKIYPTLAPLDAVYHLLENAPDNPLTRNLLDKRPNNYTYAKAVAEELVVNERGRIPAAIVRPTVIISSKSEPAQGWVDNWGGANGLVVAIGKGLLRTWRATPGAIGDVVPVDIVANLLIAVAWDTHVRKGDKEVKVYNCSCGLQNPLTVRRFMETCLNYTRKHNFRDVLWYPTLVVTNNGLLNSTITFLLQIVPAALIDGVYWLFRRESSLMKLQRKVLKLRSVLEFFTLHQFTFLDYNVSCLYKSLTVEDRRIFDFDVKNIDWDTFLEAYVIGIRKYLLREAPDGDVQ